MWFDEKLAGPEIVVTPPAHAVAEVILQAPLLAPLRLIVPTHRLSTAALLPERIRQQYGLRWTPAHAVALPLAAHTFGYAVAPLFQVASRITTQKPGAPREPSRPRVRGRPTFCVGRVDGSVGQSVSEVDLECE